MEILISQNNGILAVIAERSDKKILINGNLELVLLAV